VDDLLRNPADQPSIGIILFKSKNAVVAEYAMRDSAKPIGISEYLATVPLPADLKGSLPTAEDLEAELKED
jgi:YhcG PDDEXK nuclease domain